MGDVKGKLTIAEAIVLFLLLAAPLATIRPSDMNAYATEVTEFPLPGVPPASPTPIGVTMIQRDVRCPSPAAQQPGVYFVESASNKIGRLAFYDSNGCPLAGPAFTEWTIPTVSCCVASPPFLSGPGIAANPDAITVAFTEPGANKIGLLNTQSNQITELTLPVNGGPTAITWVDSNRAAFLMPTTNQIGIYNRAINTFIFFSVPTGSAGITGIATDRVNAVWFTENSANKIGKLDLVNRNIFEFTLPPRGAVTSHGPTGILVDRDGFVWALGGTSGTIFKMNPATNVFSSFFTPTITGSNKLLGIANDTARRIWFTEEDPTNGNKIGRLEPITNQFIEVSLISASPAPTGIAFEVASNAMWFTNSQSNSIGRIITPGFVQVFTSGSIVTTTTQPGSVVTVSVAFVVNSAITSTATSATASFAVTSGTSSLAGTFSTVVSPLASSAAGASTAATLVDTQVVAATSSISSAIATTFVNIANVTLTSFFTTILNTTATTTIPFIIPTSTTLTTGTTFTTARSITIIPGFPAESLMVGGAIAVLAIILIRDRAQVKRRRPKHA